MNPRKKKPTAIKRKQVYINKGFQTRFIVKFFLILILSGAISVGLTLFNTQGTLTTSFENSKLVIQNTSLAIMPSVLYTTLITTAVISLLVIMVTLLVSHKIAGPMFRFEKDIDRIATGDLSSRIRTRKGDQFQELATSLNNMINSLNKNLEAVKQEVDLIAQNKDFPQEVLDEINQLNKKIDSRFKL
jgi:methyl-accepting chemotaxis protein